MGNREKNKRDEEKRTMIDVSALTYSDAVMFCEDYLSEAPVYSITDDEFHQISACYGMDTVGLRPICKRFRI